jgi:hypothetical protein
MKKKHICPQLPAVSSQSVSVLLWGALVILLQLGYIAFDIFSGTVTERFYAVQLYRACFDYILLEIAILVGGAFLFDVVVKDADTAR